MYVRIGLYEKSREDRRRPDFVILVAQILSIDSMQ